jgi:uncharacterized membrane protein YebE (DUF533 family)
MGGDQTGAAMKLTKVVITMGLLVALAVAGNVAVREWYQPDVRSEQERQFQAREPERQGRRDLGISVHRENAGTLIDFGTQRRQPLSAPEPFVGQITPKGGKNETRKPDHRAFLSALAGLLTGGLLLALLLGWRPRRKPKALLAATDLEAAEILRGRQNK